ncbi:MAG: two-component system, sensor histidine kinase and response regulator [Frankiales bacterium]|jgi:CheY-like chemotaxis protein/HPt (histidine-containing phosphotransfer) domain-containing protein|nr:two-component system, sensor histidine kinase and response regulator [Frankiales bacterium]
MRDTERNGAGHVLLAEDDHVSQAVAGAMLASLGLDVDVVGDGAEAVKAATKNHYQAILLDCQLPILDGYQVATEIRRLQAGSRRTPIIAVTATPMRSGQEPCLLAGMDDYLAKPYNSKALAAVLSRWMPDRSLRTAVLDRTTPSTRPQVRQAVQSDTARHVLDPEVVGRLERLGKAAGEDLWGQLVILFLVDADARILELRQALVDDDTGAVVRSAHLLSGASANVGASDLARLCSTFETDVAQNEPMGGGPHLAAIEAELGRVRVALTRAVSAPAA